MKTKIIIGTIIIIYLLCSTLSYGILLAFFQNFIPGADYNCREDMGFSVALSVMGPISLFVAFTQSGFAEHGIQFKCNKYLE